MSEILIEQLHGGLDMTVANLGLESLDGAQAAAEVHGQLAPQALLKDFVFDTSRYDKSGKFSQLLTERDSRERFGETLSLMKGYMAYTMRLMAQGPAFRPALVDAAQNGGTPQLVLHELQDGNMSPVGVDNQQLVVSGIAQVGAESIGAHDRTQRVGAEAGHLLVAIGGSVVPTVGDRLLNGQDAVHSIKSQGNILTSLGQAERRLTALPPVGSSFTYESWLTKGIRLVWPLVNHFESGPRPADVADAVPYATVQAYRAVTEVGQADRAKQLMEQTVVG